MAHSTITYPNDKFLHETFVAQGIQKYLQGDLLAEKEAVVRDIGEADSVSWIEEQYSDYGDPLRRSTLSEIELRDASLFPHVKFSQFEVKSAVLKTYGIEMDFSEQVRRNKHMVDFIQRGLARGAYWLAYLINDLVFNSMTNSFSAVASTETNDEPWNVAASFVWSDTTNRVPIVDMDAITLMVEDTENYNYELERAYIRRDNFTELNNYLTTTTNVPWVLDPKKGRWNRFAQGIKWDPVHKLAGIPASTALCLSRNIKPTTIFERTDKRYVKTKIRDNSGVVLPGSYHVHKYFTDEDHVTHIQVWRELYPVTNRWGRKSIGLIRSL